MSSSTSASKCRWPRYGPVPLGRCPDCPRTAPLKRLVTMTNTNGNLGREYVKCESKPEVGKKLDRCTHFEWLDEYIERIEVEGASLEQLGSAKGVAEEKVAELGLKKMNKQLLKLINLKT